MVYTKQSSAAVNVSDVLYGRKSRFSPAQQETQSMSTPTRSTSRFGSTTPTKSAGITSPQQRSSFGTKSRDLSASRSDPPDVVTPLTLVVPAEQRCLLADQELELPA